MSYTFVSFQQITFKLGNFTNLKALFSVVSTDFPFFHAKSWEKTVKKSIQNSLRFWIPRRGFWIPDTGFQSLSAELGFWIPIVSWIPDSLNCSPDSKAQDF